MNFKEVKMIVPRGKHTLDIYKNSVRFHGSSYNYHVDYKNITRGFLLPLPDEVIY